MTRQRGGGGGADRRRRTAAPGREAGVAAAVSTVACINCLTADCMMTAGGFRLSHSATSKASTGKSAPDTLVTQNRAYISMFRLRVVV